MLPSHTNTYLSITLFITFLLYMSPCLPARPTPGFPSAPAMETMFKEDNYTWQWQSFQNFLNAKRGSHIPGMFALKRYFHHFGYLLLRNIHNARDIFDARLESAVISYQAKLGLQVTGKLDSDTIFQMMAPRCGVPDFAVNHTQTLHSSRNYLFFPGKPRWGRQIPMKLTYSFSQENVKIIDYLSLPDMKQAFKRAFATWGSVIPVSFVETEDYVFADIKIGFFNGDHGDGEPFDGILGVLAHSFSPESGKFHLDAAERWALDFEVEKSKVAVDLESVAVHEIGHLLGLAHSPVKEAVMYPSLKPRKKKVELSIDDVRGVQALYGSNPNFTFGSLLESDISTNQAVHFRARAPNWATAFIMALIISCLCM